VADALDAGETAVSPQAVGHLDLAENELESIELLRPYSRLLSLDVSHNNVEQLVGLPPTLLHLNVAYNRLEGIEGIGSWGGGLLELNLSYNLLTSLQPLEQITQLQVLLAGGNRISSLIGLAGLGRLEHNGGTGID
jgi:Leucine-rich repeat (LRR) protein